MGGCGRGLSACNDSAAAASSAPSTSGAGPGDRNINIDLDNDDDKNDDHEDNTTDSDNNDNNDDNDDKVPGEANTPPEDENSCWVPLLASVVCTSQDYCLGLMVPLLDASTAAQAAFEAIKLQAPMFFASHLLVCTRGFLEEVPPICFCCMHRNLMALLSRCNHNY